MNKIDLIELKFNEFSGYTNDLENYDGLFLVDLKGHDTDRLLLILENITDDDYFVTVESPHGLDAAITANIAGHERLCITIESAQFMYTEGENAGCISIMGDGIQVYPILLP